MASTILEDAHAVLLPAFDSLTLSESVRRFLDAGGVSILLGESRAEYVARCMHPERCAAETAQAFAALTREARSRSGLLLTAVDQEMGGICRLHSLVPSFPPSQDISGTAPEVIEETAARIARAATGFGVNMFLAPVLDVLDGDNPWLVRRTWSGDPAAVARLSCAYVRGAQSAGVAATAKHFPGFRSVTGDPATNRRAVSLTSITAVEAGLVPFRAVISAGVEAMMVGPAIVAALDDRKPALRSTPVVRKLRRDLGFSGVVMADDLDAQATLLGDDLATVAVEALNAGCDHLLLADIGQNVERVAEAIVDAVRQGALSAERLAQAADKVRGLARRYSLPAV